MRFSHSVFCIGFWLLSAIQNVYGGGGEKGGWRHCNMVWISGGLWNPAEFYLSGGPTEPKSPRRGDNDRGGHSVDCEEGGSLFAGPEEALKPAEEKDGHYGTTKPGTVRLKEEGRKSEQQYDRSGWEFF